MKPDLYDFNLTTEEAIQVKEWRKVSSYRCLSIQASIKWPEKNIPSDNQPEGMMLCAEAAFVLKENEHDWKVWE